MATFVPTISKKRRLAGIIFCCWLLLFFQLPLKAQPAPQPQLPPPDVLTQLQAYRAKDDLSGWIYAQIQWVAKDPLTRSGLLVRAAASAPGAGSVPTKGNAPTAGSAWRSPRTNEEIQAWQDLLANEGYALLMSGDIVHSTDAYTAAFQWAGKYPEITDSALLLENILMPLGNNYTRLGDYEQALFIHRKALSIALSTGNADALAGTCSNLANTCSNMGLPEQSLAYCRQGLAVAKDHSALRGLLLSEQADALEQMRQTTNARESIGQSILALERARAGRGEADAGYWLLMVYQQAGDIYGNEPAALSFYTKALALQDQLLRRHGNIRTRERAKLFLRLGTFYARSGQMVGASSAQTTEAPLGQTAQTARSLYWLDKCLSVLVPGKTIGSLRESDLYAENTLMDLLFVRAGLCSLQHKTDLALRLYAFCFATEKMLRRELISGTSRERSVADSRSRYEEAIGTAWEAWKKTNEQKYRDAMLAFMESSKSQLLLEQVLQQQQVMEDNAPGDSLRSRIRLLERALVYYQSEALQSGRSQPGRSQPGGPDAQAAKYADQEKQTDWELAQLRKRERAAVNAQSAAGSRLSANTEGAVRPSDGSRSAPAPVSDGTFSPASLPGLLTEGQLVRSFFAGSKAIYTVECGRAGILFAEKLDLPGSWQDSVRSFIREYFTQGANPMIDHPDAYCRSAYLIYRALFGFHPLQTGKQYILLPDGALTLLPVDALLTAPGYSPSPEKWPFALRQAQVSYGWSLETLQEQKLERGQEAGGSAFSAFFLARTHNGGQDGLPQLEATTAEKTGIERVIPKGHWYTDEQATYAAFRKALEESVVVHISAHAFTRKDSLDVPYIELFDQPFYLFELGGLEHHPDLVVLNACRTGDGRMVAGEGVQSLARAFTAGGASGVVAAWWNVNDQASAQLMQAFYTALASGRNAPASRPGGPATSGGPTTSGDPATSGGPTTSGVPATSGGPAANAVNIPSALRQAKLDWLNDPAVLYVHKLPYYWAALNYQGNPEPLPPGFTLKGNNAVLPDRWTWKNWLVLLLSFGILLIVIRRFMTTRIM